MFSLPIILTLLAPIVAAVLVYVIVRLFLSRLRRRAETAAFTQRSRALAAADISAARSEAERARHAA
jgi:hypothetical protein